MQDSSAIEFPRLLLRLGPARALPSGSRICRRLKDAEMQTATGAETHRERDGEIEKATGASSRAQTAIETEV